MIFLEKFIEKINSLEESYGELYFIYDDYNNRESFHLLNKNGEVAYLNFSSNTEKNILKAIYYSYAVKLFASEVSDEDLDMEVYLSNILAVNSVLLKLNNAAFDIENHSKNFIGQLINYNESEEYKFFEELAYWYSISIIGKKLPYKVSLELIHEGLTKKEEDSLLNLKRALYIDSANAIVSDAYRFLSLTVSEVNFIKASIMYSFLEDEEVKQLVHIFLAEISNEYLAKENARGELILKVIASFGKNKYQQFEERFRKSKVWRSTNFTNNINNFELLILAEFSDYMEEELENGEDLIEDILIEESNEIIEETMIEEESIIESDSIIGDEGIFYDDELNFIEEDKIFEDNLQDDEATIEESQSINDAEADEDYLNELRAEIFGDLIKEKLSTENLDNKETALEDKNDEDNDESLEGLEDLIEELKPANIMAERTNKIKNEKARIELSTIIKEINDKEADGYVYINFKPLNKVINLLKEKGYKITELEESIKIEWE